MIAEMSAGSLGLPDERSLQATQDATKWNECVSASALAAMHDTLFNKDVRAQLSLPPPSEQAELFKLIACVGNFLISMKMITLGDGVMVENQKEYSRIEWIDEHRPNMSEKTREWYDALKDYRYGKKYVLSSGGMLMGMMLPLHWDLYPLCMG